MSPLTTYDKCALAVALLFMAFGYLCLCALFYGLATR